MFTLIDLEELLTQCRDAKTKALLREATDCYRAGAYRSCIVGTWIALVYDFIEKFRELALTGDKAATDLVAEIDTIHAARDTEKALTFERNILEIARDRYELISAQEYADLSRLREDRHRFAHPNLNQDSEGISASPELARLHLRCVIEHVLSRPPVQGKAAIATVLSLVESEYFPEDSDEAFNALSSGPLKRAKKALVREFLFGAITSTLREDLGPKAVRQRIAAARACYRMHDVVAEQLLSEGLIAAISPTSDKKIPYLLYLIGLFPEIRRFLDIGTKLRLEKYVPLISEDDIALAAYGLEIDFLRLLSIERLKRLSAQKLRALVERLIIRPPRELVELVLLAYERASSWDSANTLAAVLQTRLLNDLTENDAGRIVHAGVNAEVSGSFAFPKLVEALVKAGKLSVEALNDSAKALHLEATLGEFLIGAETAADADEFPF